MSAHLSTVGALAACICNGLEGDLGTCCLITPLRLSDRGGDARSGAVLCRFGDLRVSASRLGGDRGEETWGEYPTAAFAALAPRRDALGDPKATARFLGWSTEGRGPLCHPLSAASAGEVVEEGVLGSSAVGEAAFGETGTCAWSEESLDANDCAGVIGLVTWPSVIGRDGDIAVFPGGDPSITPPSFLEVAGLFAANRASQNNSVECESRN